MKLMNTAATRRKVHSVTAASKKTRFVPTDEGGEFPDGKRVLRAKIQVDSPNIWMRDPLIYRIKHAEHHHTGGKWCIYPMYDFAHCLSDYIEGITTASARWSSGASPALRLDSRIARPAASAAASIRVRPPLARLHIMSKRKLMQLVTKSSSPAGTTRVCRHQRNQASGSNIGRPQGVRLQHRHHEIQRHHRRERAGVRHPRRPEQARPAPPRGAATYQSRAHELSRGQNEELDAVNNPEDESAGKRKIPFSRELFIEQDDSRKCRRQSSFASNPVAKWRLKYAYIIKCDEVVKDAAAISPNCAARRPRQQNRRRDGGPQGQGHDPLGERRARGGCGGAPLRPPLQRSEPEKDGRDFKSVLNPYSLEVLTAKCEPSLKDAQPELRYQFERSLTSRSIWIPSPASSSSTAPSR